MKIDTVLQFMMFSAYDMQPGKSFTPNINPGDYAEGLCTILLNTNETNDMNKIMVRQ